MNPLTNPLTGDKARSILNALPPSRRNTYLSMAQGCKDSTSEIEVQAASLYIWNGYVASTVDRTTGEVEVLLRNFIDRCFSTWNSSEPRLGSTEWLLNPEGVLRELALPEESKRLIDYADIRTVTGTPSHNDYIAGLTFGTWIHLLPKKHAGENNSRVILWNEALEPHLGAMNRRSFQDAAMHVKDMRNRATHRRPIIKDLDELRETHRRCVEIAKSIDPNVGTWLRDEQWIPRALRQDPRK